LKALAEIPGQAGRAGGLHDQLHRVAERAVLALVELHQIVAARDAAGDHRIAFSVDPELDPVSGPLHEAGDAGGVGSVEHAPAHAFGRGGLAEGRRRNECRRGGDQAGGKAKGAAMDQHESTRFPGRLILADARPSSFQILVGDS
jgi:hypothetical protein